MNNQSISSNSQKVIKGVSSQTIVTISLGIVEIISFSIMSRLLTQQDFGYYAAIVALSTVFSALSNNGIGSAIVQKKAIDEKYIDNAFSLSFLFGVAAMLLLLLLAPILAHYVADDTMCNPLRLYSITLLFSCISSINISLLHRKMQLFRIGIIHLLSLIITTITAVFLAINGYGFYAILTKGILGSLLTMLMTFYASHAKYRFSFNLHYYKSIFGFSGWLMASSIFRNFANQVDRLMMSSLFSVSTLGFYSRPKEFITNVCDKINSIFDMTLFPVLSGIQDEEDKLRRSFISTLYYLNIVGVLLSSLCIMNSALIIKIFFGEEWMNTNSLFQLLALQPILYINGRIGDIYLRSLALTKYQFYFRVSQLLVSVFLILIAAPFGIYAVATAALLAYLLIAFSKMCLIGHIIDLPLSVAIKSLGGIIPFTLILFVVVVALSILSPMTIIGDIIRLICYILVVLIVLVFFPSFLGSEYKEHARPLLVNYLKTKICNR